jgi:glycosyltransferase involved in cell wall biosynthesis
LKPDIVHTHTPKAGLLGMLAAKLTGVPIRIHTIGGLPLMTASGWKRALLVMTEKLTCWGALHVWPNSKSLLNYVEQQKLCPKHKLSIIADGSSNGIDLEAFSRSQLDQTTIAEVKRSINYQEDNRYLLAIGRMVKDKGIEELVVAFELLFNKQPKLRLLLIGPLEELRSEERLSAATLKTIQQHTAIYHINWTTEIAAYLSLADLLLHASHREGFPNVLLQAGAMECPIVCSDIAGNIDVVAHQQTGLTYPVGNIPALVNAVVETLLNPQQAQLRTQRLRARIEKKFERKRLQKTLLVTYRQLLKQNKP